MKTLLYYPSVSCLFCYGDKALQKIQRVLPVFCESRDKLSVLWLLDPYLPVLAEKRPELMEGYEKGLALFVNNGGTTREDPGKDLTEELLRRCDAYYGDPSYYAECFETAGKPVMIQDIGI